MKTKLIRATLAAVLSLACLATSASAAAPDKWAHWVTKAGVPSGVTIRSLDFLGPTLFASGESDGVFSSPTVVGPWGQQNTGLDPQTGAQSVRQVKLGPNGLLYAATSAGLFSAQPGGAWSPVGQGAGPRKLNMGGIQSIVFNDPSGTDMTVAVAGAGGAGVYYSSDGGSNWDRASGMPTPESVYFLTSTPAGTPTYAAADNGVYVSLNFGRSWTLLSDGIPPGETTLRVAYAPDNPAHLYASTSSGVYKSTNAGFTWSEAEGTEGQTLPASGGKRAFLLTPALEGKFGQNRAVVGTEQGAWATIDDGAHWGQMSLESVPASPNMNRIVWSLGIGFSPPSILAGTAGFGVFSILPQPIEAGTVTIAPSSSLKPGDEMVASLSGWEGTKPYFFSYQWKRCATNGCTPTTNIPGAIGPTYTIPDDDAGDRVRFAVTAIGRNLVHPSFVSATSNPTADADVAALPGTTPRPSFVLADQPKLTPSTSQPWGTVFTIVNGKWRTEASSTQIFPAFKYLWQRCDTNGNNCVDIVGQTGQTYTSTPADIAHELKAYIRGTSGGVSSDYWFAGGTADLLNKFPVNTVAPKIVGDPLTGIVLGSAAGGWDGFDMTYERRWLRCEADGLGCNPTNPVVTSPTYALGGGDVGKRLKLEVTAVAEDANQDRRTTAFSALTPVISNPPSGGGSGGGGSGGGSGGGAGVVAPKVKVDAPNKVKPGTKLKVPASFPGFKSPKYQWLRNGKAIKKATKRTYQVTARDRGKKISCRITMTPAAGGAAVTVTTKPVTVPKKKKKHRRH